MFINNSWINHLNHNKEKTKENFLIWRKIFHNKINTDVEFKEKWISQIKERILEKYKNWYVNKFKETKQTLRENRKSQWLWNENSQYWPIWICYVNLQQNKKIRTE